MVNGYVMALLRDIAILFPAFLIVFTFHGFARAIVARWMGDNTAYQEGYVSLNPLMHVDIMSMTVVLLIVFLVGGLFAGALPRSMLYILLLFMGVRWTYSIPFEVRNFKSVRRGMILTTLAGPLSCFVLTFLFLYVQKYLFLIAMPFGVAKSLQGICAAVVVLGAYFGVLGLLPIPPFDGGRLLQFILPYSKQGIVHWLEEYSFFILLALFLVPGISDLFFGGINILGFYIISFLSGFVL
jgi:Peptidase family M50.